MQRDEILAKLRQARAIVREIADGTDNPMLERCLYFADMNLHWAEWGLGEFRSLTPELEDEPSVAE